MVKLSACNLYDWRHCKHAVHYSAHLFFRRTKQKLQLRLDSEGPQLQFLFCKSAGVVSHANHELESIVNVIYNIQKHVFVLSAVHIEYEAEAH